jgi:hypothetical protein
MNDVLDDFLDALAQIGALFGLPRQAYYRLRSPLDRVPLFRNAGWSGWDAESYLADYGVRTCGRGFDKTRIWPWVKDRQLNWAEYLLLRVGAPLAAIRNANNLRAWGKGPVRAWGAPLKPNDPTAWICSSLDALTSSRPAQQVDQPPAWTTALPRHIEPQDADDLPDWIINVINAINHIDRMIGG